MVKSKIRLIMGIVFGVVWVISLIAYELDELEWMPEESRVIVFSIGNMMILPALFLIIFRSSRIPKEVANGLQVMGTIETIRPAGMVNYQPRQAIMIQFTALDGQQITVGQMVPNLAMHPGAVISGRYNPDKPRMALFDPTRQMVARGVISPEAQAIVLTGVEAQGVILSVQPTGTVVDGSGEMALQVQVTRPNGGTFETTVTKGVPRELLSFVQPGGVVDVHYLPGNEKKIEMSVKRG